jgi:hypothetical protein
VLLWLAAVDHCTGERGCVKGVGWLGLTRTWWHHTERRQARWMCGVFGGCLCLPCGGYSCGLRLLLLLLLGVAQMRAGFCCQCR